MTGLSPVSRRWFIRTHHALLGNLFTYQNVGRKKTPPPTWLDFTRNLTLATTKKLDLPKRWLTKNETWLTKTKLTQKLADQMKTKLYQKRLRNKNLACWKNDFASKMDFDEPAWAKLAEISDQRKCADFRNLTLPKLNFARKKNLRQSDLTQRLAK